MSNAASISGQCGILEPDCELIKRSRWQVEHHAFSSWQHFTYNEITQNGAIAKLISFCKQTWFACRWWEIRGKVEIRLYQYKH